ncbi:hypothetical protein P175DRAFT_094904 [Aspergillus ochraceoroseus IBT 24754]|uniref:Secreted protein n=1 Tax=Aspergillus ochraceoroseus IBT 24754 TaxID=1392256 RepID=A0A2T5LMN2_9EURO|nr:uncharacterized protein P175DRAFT_094904 [Aspergillus ochraceoroseus IBT 24754]PTU17534.1 hypothetical protein P175DRAFT_094904 [Aspergillus ochraceoroseus IBT 24754]
MYICRNLVLVVIFSLPSAEGDFLVACLRSGREIVAGSDGKSVSLEPRKTLQYRGEKNKQMMIQTRWRDGEKAVKNVVVR